jgi:hypothetical protein
MPRDETLTEEHDRLQRRTNELCEATDSLSLSRKQFDEVDHQALALELREHHAALRAHIDRQKREYHRLG